MDNQLDEKTRAAVLENCGRACANLGFIDTVKCCKDSAKSTDELLDDLRKVWGHLHRDGDDIYVVYEECYCPQLPETDPAQDRVLSLSLAAEMAQQIDGHLALSCRWKCPDICLDGADIAILFRIDLEFQEDLESMVFSDRLREQSENNDIGLPQNVTIRYEEEHDWWLVNDEDRNILWVMNKAPFRRDFCQVGHQR
jgi:hypothetical protein